MVKPPNQVSSSDRELERITTLQRTGQLSEALAACRSYLASKPARPDVLALAGALSLKLGDLTGAEAAYRGALALKPSFAEAHFNLGNVLVKLGRHAEAAAAFGRTLELNPALVVAHNNLGNALYELGEHLEASASFRRALQLEPNTAHLHRNLGTALHALGESPAALQAFQQAVTLKPGSPKELQSLASAALECGEWQLAARTCTTWLKHSPANVEALGLASIALQELGKPEAAHALLDLDRMVQVIQLTAPPAGFSSVSDFNAALARHALEHPTLTVPARADARTELSRLAAIYACPTLRITEEFCADEGASAVLRGLVGAALEGYLANLARTLPGHPFMIGAPQRLRLRSWAAVLDREGSLESHAHYGSRVSMVYYAQIPGEMRGESESAGYFEFGGGPSRYPCRVTPRVRTIQPRAGMLLLFPSYFYHRTVPFNAPEERISIAFDAEPVA